MSNPTTTSVNKSAAELAETTRLGLSLSVAQLRAENARLRDAVRELRECMAEMMPFVLEDYYPAYASLAYKSAVEKMKSTLTEKENLT